MTPEKDRTIHGFRIAALAALVAASVLLVQSRGTIVPREEAPPLGGMPFDELAQCVSDASLPLKEVAVATQPGFVPSDFPPWREVTAETLPALLERSAARCPPERRGRILLAKGDAAIATPRLEELPGAVRDASGRIAVPLAELLVGVPRAFQVRLWPCTGRPRDFIAAGLSRAPGRYLLVARGDAIDLVDAVAGAVVREGIAAVVIESYHELAQR